MMHFCFNSHGRGTLRVEFSCGSNSNPYNPIENDHHVFGFVDLPAIPPLRLTTEDLELPHWTPL